MLNVLILTQRFIFIDFEREGKGEGGRGEEKGVGEAGKEEGERKERGKRGIVFLFIYFTKVKGITQSLPKVEGFKQEIHQL